MYMFEYLLKQNVVWTKSNIYSCQLFMFALINIVLVVDLSRRQFYFHLFAIKRTCFPFCKKNTVIT